jgi:hypothetical protein
LQPQPNVNLASLSTILEPILGSEHAALIVASYLAPFDDCLHQALHAHVGPASILIAEYLTDASKKRSSFSRTSAPKAAPAPIEVSTRETTRGLRPLNYNKVTDALDTLLRMQTHRYAKDGNHLSFRPPREVLAFATEQLGVDIPEKTLYHVIRAETKKPRFSVRPDFNKELLVEAVTEDLNSSKEPGGRPPQVIPQVFKKIVAKVLSLVGTPAFGPGTVRAVTTSVLKAEFPNQEAISMWSPSDEWCRWLLRLLPHGHYQGDITIGKTATGLLI